MRLRTTATGLALALLLAPLPEPRVHAAVDEQRRRSDATLDAGMRELWDAQTTWTRFYVVSALGDLPDTAFVRTRLFRCPIDFEATVGPYYGSQSAQDLAGALGMHLHAPVKAVRATKAGNAQALAELKLRWRADAFRELLDIYLQLVDRGIVLRARGDYAADVGNFGE